MSFIDTNLTREQILAALDKLRLAYLSGDLEVHFENRSRRFQSASEILKAIQAGEDWLRSMSGAPEVRVSFAQHKRGDGPTGPSRFWF
jgi:hypothetical protein